MQLTDEQLKAAKAAQKKDDELKEACQALRNYEPWKVYRAHLNRIVEQNASNLMQPLQSMDAVLLEQYIKGTMNGLILARDHVDVILSPEREGTQT